jgi:hypothetical protein
VYGSWFLITLAGIAILMLAVALASAAWLPVFGIGLGMMLAVFVIASMATRRTAQVGREHASARDDEEQQAEQVRSGGHPRAGTAPVSDEG